MHGNIVTMEYNRRVKGRSIVFLPFAVAAHIAIVTLFWIGAIGILIVIGLSRFIEWAGYPWYGDKRND